jgi:hypothetical protein
MISLNFSSLPDFNVIALKDKSLKANGKRQQESGSRYQVPDSPNPIVDTALSPWPRAFHRYHLSGHLRKRAVSENKNSKEQRLCHVVCSTLTINHICRLPLIIRSYKYRICRRLTVFYVGVMNPVISPKISVIFTEDGNSMPGKAYMFSMGTICCTTIQKIQIPVGPYAGMVLV